MSELLTEKQAAARLDVRTAASPVPDADVPSAEILSSKDVATLLGRNHKTIEKAARDGRIPAHFRLNRWYFFKSELDEWLRSGVNSGCQPCRVN